jgi:predicted RNA-binding protein YlxR (DUF448 family)
LSEGNANAMAVVIVNGMSGKLEKTQTLKPLKQPKQRRTPQRTCVGCREVQPKRGLIRIVRSPQGVEIDPTGKVEGRGAYLHDKRSCWEKGLKGALAHALKTQLSGEDNERLNAFALTLADE